MKVLWITNIPLPEASNLMGIEASVLGGWLLGASDNLIKAESIELSVAFPQVNAVNVKELKGRDIQYYVFPSVSYSNKSLIDDNPFLENIINLAKPDIVHIFGTEFAHTLAAVNICKKRNIKSVISIQGLVSVCSKHYTSGIPAFVQSRFTFRDFIKQDNILQQAEKFCKRGEVEIEAIKKADYIIGRTTWDKTCTKQINSCAQYFHCNEILRPEFYKNAWNIGDCEKHTVFVSQGSYPIKGLHFMLQAMPIILEKYPDMKLYIAGVDITNKNTLKNKLRISSYGLYLNELIKTYELDDNVFFTGILNEEQMCRQHLKSHVFVSCSLIENESNSLSEAKILGVPCVASYVGGVVDRVQHKFDGLLYQHDAPYMLANYISEVFENNAFAEYLSENAKQIAAKTHDASENTRRLMEIYHTILS